jgi:hypothetical protein
MAVPGLGMVTGAIGNKLYEAAGLPNVMLGGPGKGGMQNWEGNQQYTGGMPPGAAAPGGQPSQGGSLLNGGFSSTGNGGGLKQLQNLAQINANVSGNPAAPESVGPATPTGPNYNQIMASIRQVTPDYSVSLPGYQYGKATV